MNSSPSRHPAFIAIACLSLFAAWSTPEAEVVTLDKPRAGLVKLSEALPPMIKTPVSLETDCIAHAGSQRALCVFAATRQKDAAAPLMTAQATTGKASPSSRRDMSHNVSAEAPLSAKRVYSGDRARSDRFVSLH